MSASTVRRAWWPSAVLLRFATKRLIKGGIIWGIVFGITVASSAIAYKAAYATPAARQQVAATFSSNIGVSVLLGQPHHLDTISGFTGWRSLGIVIIIGSIWAILASTRLVRGEETVGRWESFLAGRITRRGLVVQLLASLAATLLAMYMCIAIVAVAVGRSPGVAFSVSGSLFLALSMVLGVSMFAALGAFMSQLMPTRSRAAAATAGIFGISFAARAIANVADIHWLLAFTPLGWIDHLQPLGTSQPLWLLPIVAFAICCSLGAVYLAGKRDLGASIIADTDEAKPRYGLLHSAFGLAVRITRGGRFGWVAGMAVASFAFCSLAKTAGEAFSQSAGLQQAINRLLQTRVMGEEAFIGTIFFVFMAAAMVYATNMLGAIRETEAEGYADNLLVRSISRVRWLGGRLAILAASLVLVGVSVGAFGWLGAHLQHSSVSAGDVIGGGLHTIVPAVFLTGVGMVAFGFWPRITTNLMYGVVAWSFLMEMLASVGTINHWILDTSLLHHVSFVPAASPRWDVIAIMLSVGVIGSVMGIWRFTRRDLIAE